MSLHKRKHRQRSDSNSNQSVRRRVVKKSEPNYSKRIELHAPKVPPLENRIQL